LAVTFFRSKRHEKARVIEPTAQAHKSGGTLQERLIEEMRQEGIIS
jgi:hypothetical protein